MKQFILLLLIVTIMSCGETPPSNSTDTVAPNWENGLIKTNNISYTSIDLSWSGDSDNVAVTKYKLFKDNSLLNDNILTNNFGVTNLTQDTTYKFKVEACDKANNCSINGPEINVKTLKEEIQNEAPIWAANAKIEGSEITTNSVKLSWSEAVDDVNIKEYILYKNNIEFKRLTERVTTVDSLTHNTNYTFKVIACDYFSLCTQPIEVEIKTLKEEIQNEAPVWAANAKIEGSEITTNSVKLSWSEAVDDVNIKEYVLYKDNIEFKRLTERVTTVDSLTHNTNYTFKVVACDDFSLCTQPIEVEIKTIKENEAPIWAANAKIEATDIQLFQITVKWDFATDDFGISKYILYINGNKYDEFDINVSETTITQLNRNTNYTFKIEALDTHGLETANGPFVTIKTLNYPPVPQWNDEFIEVIEKGRSGVLLYFRGAVDDNEVTGYKIYQNGTLVKTTGIETTFAKITGLMPNTNYTFKVEAIDIDNNESTDGPSIDVLTNNDIPQTLGEVPELDPTKVTHIFEATSFLYDGLNPIQMGIDPKIIDRDRVSVIRGRVLNDNNEPIQGVLVKMLHNGKFGYTYTRDDGWFDMVVNGGGTFVVDYQKEGLLTVQRKMETQINDYFVVDDIVMIPYDTISNELINNSDEVQIIKGTTQTDSDGTRTATLFVPKNTIAKMKMPNGEYQELTTFHARATEYTVGENGVKRMPAELPANTGYTYAVELSVDEAEEVGATTVEFNQNLYFYLENFLNFDTGVAVPTGYYDKDKAIWVAQQDGVVVKILDIDENNLVSLDINGDDVPEDFEMLEKLGFTEDELDFIAVNYQTGQNLWRVPIKHFTPVDCNLGVICNGCRHPLIDGILAAFEQFECKPTGSVIGAFNETLGEVVGIAGTNFALVYNTFTAKEYKKDNILKIPVGDYYDIYSILDRIEVVVTISGRSFQYWIIKNLSGQFEFKESFNDTGREVFSPNIYNGDSILFEWDGKDNNGRLVYGTQNAKIKISYYFSAKYSISVFSEEAYTALMYVGSFGKSKTGSESEELTRESWIYSVKFNMPVGYNQPLDMDFGKWGLNIKHVLIPQLNKIYKAIGDLKDSIYTNKWVIHNVKNIYSTTSPYRYMTDNYIIQDGEGITYFLGSYAVYKMDKEGNIELFAGTFNQTGDSGDGGLATNARLGFIHTIALDEMGNLYISDGDNAKIRKVDKNTNIITTVAGNGEKAYSGVGNNADYSLIYPLNLAINNNNEVYFYDGLRGGIKKIDSNHILRNVLKGVSVNDIAVDNNGNTYYVTYSSVYKVTSEGEIILLATHSSYTDLRAVAVNIDGSVYFANWCFIKKINTDGTITDIAGDGTSGYIGNNEPALNAKFKRIEDLTFDNEGNLYIADTENYVIRKIDANGIITTIAGTGYAGSAVDGGNPLTTSLSNPTKIAVDSNKTIYVVENSSGKLFKFKENEIIQIINRRSYNDVGYSGDNGSVFDAKFSSSITGLEVDSLNNLYISDSGNKVIRKVDTTNIVTTFAGKYDSNYNSSSENHYRGDGLQANQVAVDALTMAIGKDGTIYFADFSNSNIAIRRIYSDGYVERMILKDETGNEVKLTAFNDFVIKDDILYFTTKGDYCGAVYKVDLTTNIVTKLAGTGVEYCNSYWPLEGSLAIGQYIHPFNLMVDKNNNVYFQDEYRIFKIAKDGLLRVVAGGCGALTKQDWDQWGSTQCNQKTEGNALNVTLNGYYIMGSDENIWIYRNSCSNISVMKQNEIFQDINNDSFMVFSEDGSLIYEFDPYGKHLKTKDSILNKTLLEFRYDNSGMLTKIIDENYNETNFVREGENVTIRSPYGELTYLAIENGLLRRVVYEDDTFYSFGYKTITENETTRETELLSSFTNPRGNTSTFEYDDIFGTLIKDINAVNGSKSLYTNQTDKKRTTTLTTAMERESKFEVKRDFDGNTEYKNTSSDGRCIISQLKEDGSGTITQPDGTIVEMSQTADPRFGWQIPYTNKIKTTLPSGKSVTIETQKTAELLENDIFKPSKLKTQTTINGSRTVTKEIDVVNKTIKTKSPMGKEGISYFDEKGQIVQSEIPGMLPVNYRECYL